MILSFHLFYRQCFYKNETFKEDIKYRLLGQDLEGRHTKTLRDIFEQQEKPLPSIGRTVVVIGHLRVDSDTANDIQAISTSYIKQARRQQPNHAVMKTKQYLSSNNLRAVPFDKGAVYCLMHEF